MEQYVILFPFSPSWFGIRISEFGGEKRFLRIPNSQFRTLFRDGFFGNSIFRCYLRAWCEDALRSQIKEESYEEREQLFLLFSRREQDYDRSILGQSKELYEKVTGALDSRESFAEGVERFGRLRCHGKHSLSSFVNNKCSMKVSSIRWTSSMTHTVRMRRSRNAREISFPAANNMSALRWGKWRQNSLSEPGELPVDAWCYLCKTYEKHPGQVLQETSVWQWFF